MLRSLISTSMLSALLSCLAISPCMAWDTSEHQFLGDTVFFRLQSIDSVLLDPDLLEGMGIAGRDAGQSLASATQSFGELCAHFAADDQSHKRFHDRGKTVLDQLRTLDSCDIAEAISKAIAGRTLLSAKNNSINQYQAPRIPATNTIGAYLLHHLMALRLVGQSQDSAVDRGELLRQGLVLESIAQGYLADAFSAGHILVPLSDPFSSLHHRNNRETHNHYCTEGVYVINARGDVWQTFGDRLLRWYAHSLSAVVEACEYSLSEVMVTYHVMAGDTLPDGLRVWMSEVAPGVRADELVAAWLLDRDGAEYFDALRMPTLMLIPMPVAASWSIRTETTDAHGIRQRHHYPQLSDDGLHDPDCVGIDDDFLYARSSVPDWLIPEPLRSDAPSDPSGLTRSDPNWASVRWVQNRSVAPSFKGALLHLGGQLLLEGDSPQLVETFGVGYGFYDDLILLRNISAELSVQGVSRKNDPWVVSLSLGGGLTFAGIPLIRALHVEGGPAIVGHSGSTTARGMVALGLDSSVLPLGFTHAGVTVRVKYVSLLGDHSRRGPALELVLH